MGSHILVPGISVEARKVLDHLRRIVQALRAGSRSAERTVGLSTAQLFVLSRLNDAPALSINELALRTGTHQSSVSVVVSKLAANGMLRRSRSKDDGRLAVVSTTDKGRAALRRAPSTTQDVLVAALGKLTAPERRRLATLLGRWVKEAGLDHETPSMFFESKSSRRPPRHAPT